MTKTPAKTAQRHQPIFVARQPIFTREQDIWGYELLFRHSGHGNEAKISDPDIATAKVIADGLSMVLPQLDAQKKVLINFPQNLLAGGVNVTLPPEQCIIEILETVAPTPEILDSCNRIKQEGYMLALDDFVGNTGYEPFLELADIVKVDVLGQSKDDIIKLSQRLKHYNCRLLAEKVEDADINQLTMSLGYSYFQGYYFSKPEIIEGHKISTEDISTLQLLEELSKEDFEVRDLDRIISTDISLSYRLLKYINSAYFALQQKVQSITQAITLLGSKLLRNWLMVIILSDLDRGPRDEELITVSVTRARFLTLLAKIVKRLPYKPETMFMLGLFSKLDALLSQQMEEVLEALPLEEEIIEGLCGRPNKAYDFLCLAEAVEQGDWPQTEKLLEKYSLDPGKTAIAHNEARSWTHQILGFCMSI